jgi:hypothetical protein
MRLPFRRAPSAGFDATPRVADLTEGSFAVVRSAIVSFADDSAPIVLSGDDRAEIVRQADDL